jgi:hypothetical protein
MVGLPLGCPVAEMHCRGLPDKLNMEALRIQVDNKKTGISRFF